MTLALMLVIHLRINGEKAGQLNLKRPRLRETQHQDLNGEKAGAGQLNLKGAEVGMMSRLVMNL